MANKFLFFLLFNFCSAKAFHWHSESGGAVRWAFNCDFLGHDIGFVRSKSEECGEKCAQHSECTRFVWTNFHEGTCWFKNGKGDAIESTVGGCCGYVNVTKVNAISWHSGNDGRVQWSRYCEFRGNDIGSVKSKSEECGGICYEHTDCTRFVWTDFEGGTCWIKNEEGDAIKTEFGGMCGYITAAKPDAHNISWVMADQGRIRWSTNCKIVGKIVAVRAKKTSEQCGETCYLRSDCFGFIWKNGSCSLKSSGYPAIDYTNTQSVCGEIISRSSITGTGNSGGLRKSEQACKRFTEMASQYRMIRGDLTQRNDFPSMAALYYPSEGHEDSEPNESNVEIRCGGTIISEYYILTAAHCVYGITPVIARLGTNILNHQKKTDLRVEVSTVHPDFEYDKRQHDIGLVKVREEISFSGNILPACLRSDLNDVPENKDLVVAGWGLDGVNDEPNFLRKVSMITVALQSCKSYFQKSEQVFHQIGNGQYCAKDPNGGRDFCDGDSGGPLQLYESELATVVGVVSWSVNCTGTAPGVYARVAYYLDFIEDIVWEE
ncbi:Serine protease snake [Pseudolycoriella hygida]|uniref:Serine protease snake n=1 Tax=Pseudolycoriella hygida TaxID=35572 RepID=A0A9Q0S6S1_9DIPT|nr:Serine protease snake [Pseudolycoriella hygida]